MIHVTPKDIAKLRRKLLTWYRAHRRDLPWRQTDDPYSIWVSEVMLQQTRVETVIPYYQRFLDRFPTLSHLASAGEAEVLKEWEGLGYYRRARHLMAAAKEVTERYEGKLPDSKELLESLPGFGSYTSGAVASIAFQKSVPAVDGNVRRVLARRFGTSEPVDDLAATLVDPDHPGDFNQSLMELGALICVPRSPNCTLCPLAQDCVALSLNTIESLPAMKRRGAIPTIRLTSLVIRNNDRYFVRVGRSKLWEGMWEFPMFEASDEESAKETLKAEHRIILRRVQLVGLLTHILTHRRLDVLVLSGSAESGARVRGGKWVTNEQWRKLPRSRLQQKIAEIALDRKKSHFPDVGRSAAATA